MHLVLTWTDPQTCGWSQAAAQGLADLRRGMDRTGVPRPVTISTLNSMLILFFAGPDAKTLLSQPMSLVSALRNHMHAGAALFDLATLADLQQDTENFMAWLEAEACAFGMMRRYQRAMDASEQALSLLSEAEGSNCPCWWP